MLLDWTEKIPELCAMNLNWEKYFFVLQKIGGRYFIIAGLAFLLMYVIFRNRTSLKKIQARFPRNSDYAREIGYSVMTILMFAAVPLVLLSPPVRQYTTYYTDIDQYGMAYFILAFPLMLILHDTYFYWMHRMMHHPSLFRLMHLVHHKSTNPSPWAAYAFHPLEAVVETGIVPLFLFTIPIHQYHLPFFFLFMIVYNVYGHLGYELYPKGFNRHPIGRWINTSVNHNQHHQYFKGNYGLYFLFWDRIMGTIREDYDVHFDKVKN
jgi:sterol desaturase/sphingolipid hydroxylase (fatty acid hydroxylase superfamily)